MLLILNFDGLTTEYIRKVFINFLFHFSFYLYTHLL